jgi:hypothetical protein
MLDVPPGIPGISEEGDRPKAPHQSPRGADRRPGLVLVSWAALPFPLGRVLTHLSSRFSWDMIAPSTSGSSPGVEASEAPRAGRRTAIAGEESQAGHRRQGIVMKERT